MGTSRAGYVFCAAVSEGERMRGYPDEIAGLKIGDTLFNMNTNRRVYRDRNSMADYTKYFAPRTIVGETSKSWVMCDGAKVNKKTLDSACHFGDCGYFTVRGMDDDIYRNTNIHKIESRLRGATVAQLRAVADIIGYSA